MSKMKSYQRLIIGEGTKDSTKSGSIIDNMLTNIPRLATSDQAMRCDFVPFSGSGTPLPAPQRAVVTPAGHTSGATASAETHCGVWSQGSDERGGEYLCQSPPPNALSNFWLLSTDHGDDIYFDGVLNRYPAFALHFGV